MMSWYPSWHLVRPCPLRKIVDRSLLVGLVSEICRVRRPAKRKLGGNPYSGTMLSSSSSDLPQNIDRSAVCMSSDREGRVIHRPRDRQVNLQVFEPGQGTENQYVAIFCIVEELASVQSKISEPYHCDSKAR